MTTMYDPVDDEYKIKANVYATVSGNKMTIKDSSQYGKIFTGTYSKTD